MDFLSNGWFYLLAALGFGFVIFIHELGHFLFAKWAGVRVDRFSIGFGPVIFKQTIGETEYALSLLPLGGYVKMLGQEDLPSEVPAEVALNPRSYLAKSAGWKALILLAGVLFNLISSYLILLCLAWHGKPVIEPIVGDVQAQVHDHAGKNQPSPAFQLGLERGDRILTFNGKTVRDMNDLGMEVVTASKQPLHLQIERTQPDGSTRILDLPRDPSQVVLVAPNYDSGRPELGFRPANGHVVSAMLLPRDTTDIGVHLRDRLVAINGKPIPDDMIGQEIDDLLAPYYGKDVELTVDPGRRTVKVHYAGGEPRAAQSVGFPVRIDSLTSGSAAEAAGFKPGDIPVAVDGHNVADISDFLALTRAALNADRTFSVVVLRNGQEHTLTVHGTRISGRMLMGALSSPIEGYLPIIPKGADGKPSPLERAKIVAGDAIVATKDVMSGDQLRSIDVQVVSGGKPIDIALSQDDAIAVSKSHSIFPFLKLLGMHAPRSLASQLVGMRIETLGDGHGYPAQGMIRVEDAEGVKNSVDLRALSPTAVSALLSTLQVGDWITGMTVLSDGSPALQVVRGASPIPHTVSVVPDEVGSVLVFDLMVKPYKLKAWTEAFSIADDAAYGMVVKTLQIIPRFFRPAEDGGIDSNKTMTGPLGIFIVLKGSAARFGFDYYLNLIAMIGLNLFLVNLLPIPITDGGQLVFLAIETIIRRPLHESVRAIATWIGLLMVLTLMVYVIGLDIMRNLGFM